MVLLAVVKSKLEEEIEVVDVVGEKNDVIGLAKSSNFNRSKGKKISTTKQGGLSVNFNLHHIYILVII